jgi:hypothetical protein
MKYGQKFQSWERKQVMISYMLGVKANTPVVYEDHRFHVEHVVELGLHQQIRLECTVQ